MHNTKNAPPDEVHAAFEKRFGTSFRRVYTYILRRTNDHATAQRLTRDVLVRALPHLLDEDEPKLATYLLSSANQSLRTEAEAGRGQRANER